jgi:hypothetical protein
MELLWTAKFKDGHTIDQPKDDKYSKHDDSLEYNKSSFQDILDYENTSAITEFFLANDNEYKFYCINLDTGEWTVGETSFFMQEADEPTKRKLIYYRQVEQQYIDGVAQAPKIIGYCLGYEYKDSSGKTHKKVIEIHG